jgi:hypothetical protein
MGCGCKKNKSVETSVQQPTEVTVSLDENKITEQNLTLTQEQQKTVDEIVAKLTQINQS